jgi:cell division protein FtsI (penicillin-binding protein 3)
MSSRASVIANGAIKGNAWSRPAEPVLTWRATQVRSKVVLAVLMLGFLVVLIRAFVLQLVNADHWQGLAERRFERPREIPAVRGRVLDRNGDVIATSVREEHLGVVPSRIDPDSPKLPELAALLGKSPAQVRTEIRNAKGFFWLARSLDLAQADRIRALRIPGLEFQSDYRRYYPFGASFAHVVGFTNADEKGAEGLELAHDAHLRATPGRARVVVDRRNQPVSSRAIAEAMPGRDLQLSLDAGIQAIVHAALGAAMKEHRPKAASAIVIDPSTGEVLAMANQPSFDPNNRRRLNPDIVRNRAVTDAFEPGSTMKAFSVAAALELGRIAPDTRLQTDPGTITIGRRTIGDKKPLGVLTVSEILARSSNVGTVKIAEKLSSKEMHDFYTAAGFGRVPEVGLNGATTGRLRNPQRWVPIDHATISYGHGVSVSLLQLARAYTIFARDGDIVPLSFVPQPGPMAGIPVISPQTAQVMRRMLQEAAGPGGTAPKAQVEGFKVAGKTGTAHKPVQGGYAKDRYVSSFVGFAPADRPRFVIAVMVDEPSAGRHYGGEVAAPIFAQIANDALRRMQLSPDPTLRILPAIAMIDEGTQ